MNMTCEHLNKPEKREWVVVCQECFDAAVERVVKDALAGRTECCRKDDDHLDHGVQIRQMGIE